MTRKTLTYAVLPLAVAAGAIVGLAGPAAAVTPTCRTAVTTLTDRADSGLHGDWAKDAITRTVEICETPAAVGATGVGARSTYTATVVDTGTFAAIKDGKSPVAGTTLPAGVVGKLTGGYTATFTAAPAFAHYTHPLDGKTYSGTAPSTTGDWVKTLWGGGDDFTGVTNLVGWKWTYWTCSADLAKATEKWTNAAPDVNTGDITGKACPSVDPIVLPTASASPTAAPSASTSAAPVAALPITGTNVGLIAGFALVLIGGGVGLFLIGRKRRNTTT